MMALFVDHTQNYARTRQHTGQGLGQARLLNQIMPRPCPNPGLCPARFRVRVQGAMWLGN